MMGECLSPLHRAASRSAPTSAPAGPPSARAATARRRDRPASRGAHPGPAPPAPSAPPRRHGAPPRPASIAVRSRVLRPSDRTRYSPGSLLLVVGAAASAPDLFLERVLEERGIAFSLAKIKI